MKSVRRGDIFYADLSPAIGCEQTGIRPVLIVQAYAYTYCDFFGRR